jgi:amino acid transporter
VAGGVAEGSAVAVAGGERAAEARHGLRWFDGFVLALTMPAALIATVGYSIASLGTWDAVVLWGLSMVVATIANLAYSELAAMFPEKPGGIALYASEGWRTRLALVGPIATFGYWFAWSSSLAVYAGIVGQLVQAEWFAGQDWVWDLGPVDVTLARLVAAGVLVAVWLANVLGLTPTLWLAYATAAMLAVPLAVFAVVPFVTGQWSSDTFTGNLGGEGAWGGWKLGIVWLYVMLWTSLGVEVCATFTPEYRRGARDAAMALRAAALFSLAVFVLLPLGAAGAAGQPEVAAEPLTFYLVTFEELVGGAADVMVVLLLGSLLLVLNTSMADSSRALFGMSAEGTTIRGLDRQNRFGVPGRAMTVGLLVNLGLLFFFGSTLAIIAAGNLGYVAAHVFALAAFVLLRRDRPDAQRPVRLHRALVPVIGFLTVGLAFVLVVGATGFDVTGYGGTRELLAAVAILGLSLVLYAVRRLLQDGERLRLRERAGGA